MATDVDAVYGGAFKAEELSKKGLVLTISGFEVRDFEGANKIVLSFEETGQTLILNKTRKEAIKANLKQRKAQWQFAEDWVGQEITIVAGTTMFGGKKVPCIDIEEDPEDREVNLGLRRKNAQTDDDIPF